MALGVFLEGAFHLARIRKERRATWLRRNQLWVYQQMAAAQTWCRHGYRSTNPVTQASGMCWNLECRWNG